MPQVIPVPIAEPIPMKRELKRFLQTNGTILVQTKLQSLSRWKGNWNYASRSVSRGSCSIHCRAYPDEKGIETWWQRSTHRTGFLYCRAYPDEKGIETVWQARNTSQPLYTLQSLSRWKGNWNWAVVLSVTLSLSCIAEPIPMKRELKQCSQRCFAGCLRKLQSLSRWKGNWNPASGLAGMLKPLGLQSLSRWKGNWNGTLPAWDRLVIPPIAEPIPMKRELKQEEWLGKPPGQLRKLQSLSRWKGNWNII